MHLNLFLGGYMCIEKNGGGRRAVNLFLFPLVHYTDQIIILESLSFFTSSLLAAINSI